MIPLSIIIPVFNEETNLVLLKERIFNSIAPIFKEFEIIFINDGSKDKSIYIIKEMAKVDNQIKYIDFSKNFGHQIAVSAGLEMCKGALIVIMDADLQDPPELIPKLIEKSKEGFDVVYAKRIQRNGETYFKRKTASIFYSLINRLTDVEIPNEAGDFRLINRKICNIIKSMPEKNKFLRGQIAWAGFNQSNVDYIREERHSGKTNYTLLKMIQLAFDGITSFSNLPLKLATILGFVVSGFSFLVILYTLYSKYIAGGAEKGWPSIMVSILFIGGVQLICLGIIGEYIGRILDNVRDRPLYLIKETNILD
ncbi:MAG: glycosyltransferase family 2 protein [Bacteroidetes bacterium]|jgi:glycosyltransferase involved in cell wall biosynthesis|nr:glycosyltransferase family 2 protein [Bacteroidota bacterium]MBP7256062.1 glycosyltransferase family 2 protein [Chitinophagales bacterium]MBK7138422.1 glycosyltransferase family 2 protein [Bacteroidota bacterium]MBK7506554.1 glycosyltransferase family 2 protein [Bacteroidota bacterium]MBK7639980.1 glycosyltransferase family 2 protein [Bacteroidota bacterium]